ncbi:hypothetical protein ACEPAI_127 [Sanghuangporus weigelae]
MQSEGVAVGRDALRFISEAVAVLNVQHGTASDHEMWSSTEDCIESTKLPMHHEHLGPALKSALDLLKSLEAAKEALDHMARSAGRRLEILKKELQPSFFHYGIHSLPEETLIDIFMFVVDGHNPFRKNLPEVALSSVCKRFRSLVLNEPRLWSCLTSEMSYNNIMRHLDLCKDAPLTVIIRESSWSAQLCSFIDAIKPQASRWESFHFIEDNFSYSSSFAENMEKRFGNMDLPKLKTFQVLSWGTGELEGSFRLEVNIPQLFWSLMDSLDTPVLHKLRLDLHDYRGRSPDRWLDRYSAIRASVKELDFAFEFNQGWNSNLELSKLFQKFPGLELLKSLFGVYGEFGRQRREILTKDKVKSYDRKQYPFETVEHPYFYDFPNLYLYRF